MTRNCIPEEKSVVKEFFFVKLLAKLACVSKLPFFPQIKKKAYQTNENAFNKSRKKKERAEKEKEKNLETLSGWDK